MNGLNTLAKVTGNKTLQTLALSIAHATLQKLTTANILIEPCGNDCGNDGTIFKGIFIRHLGYMLADPAIMGADLREFIAINAAR